MAVTQEQKDAFTLDAEALFANDGNPVDDLEDAQRLLDDSDRPFIMFRYRQFMPNQDDPPVEKERVRTAVMYRDAEGEAVLIDPEPSSIHPVRLILLTLTNLFFPTSEAPFTADDEIFDVIRRALESADLDPHAFDGGGNQLG